MSCFAGGPREREHREGSRWGMMIPGTGMWGAISVPDELLHEVPLLLRDDPQLGELTGQRPELPAIQRHRLNTHRGS